VELLIGLFALGFFVGVPLLAVIALARAVSAGRDAGELRERLKTIEARLDGLGRRVAAAGAERVGATAPGVEPAQGYVELTPAATPATKLAASAPSLPPPPVAVAPAPAAAPMPATQPVATAPGPSVAPPAPARLPPAPTPIPPLPAT